MIVSERNIMVTAMILPPSYSGFVKLEVSLMGVVERELSLKT